MTADALDEGALFPLIAVHCFFNCGHVVRVADPVVAHDAMEVHYAAVHSAAIVALTAPFTS